VEYCSSQYKQDRALTNLRYEFKTFSYRSTVGAKEGNLQEHNVLALIIEKHPFTVMSGIYQVQYSKSLLVHFYEQYENIIFWQNNKLEVFRSFG
jgi:hypothetical protein